MEGVGVMHLQLEKAVKKWPEMQHIFSVPHSRKEYNRLVRMLDELIDTVGEKESHSLASMVETLGTLVGAYETQHVPEPKGTPIATLKELMKEHGLRQSDLPDIGTQGVVSEMLTGKRALNLRHIQLLSKRFGVSPAVFIDSPEN